MPNLDEIYANSKQLVSVAKFTYLPSCSVLWLQMNEWPDSTAFSDLSSLISLTVNIDQLPDVQGLMMPNLKDLDLIYNHLLTSMCPILQQIAKFANL
jgi:Leucine-rich repeat (LRR) protein